MLNFKDWFKKKAKVAKKAICTHTNTSLVDNWQSDGLGIPYGYKTYKCRDCGHIDKKFWYHWT